MTNPEFLKAISNSFNAFLNIGSSRSTEKLKPLHGAIAADIALRLGAGYSVKAQGYKDGKEGIIKGRYVEKRVDITICSHGQAVAGIGVKFVMQNYSQNSNNYFENMLGETANIRCNGIPYFQLFILPDKLPYYNKKGEITHWETFTEHNIAKYIPLSQDDTEVFRHTPNKTLIYVVHIPDCGAVGCKTDYLDFYRCSDCTLQLSENTCPDFGPAVIMNDYEKFIDKVYHSILAI